MVQVLGKSTGVFFGGAVNEQGAACGRPLLTIIFLID